MKKKSIIIVAFIVAAIVVVIVTVFVAMSLSKPSKEEMFKDCEKLLARNVAAINTRAFDMMRYEKDSGLKAQFDYMECYEEIVKRDELFYKNSYTESYKEDINFIGKYLGEDFQVAYSIKNKEELDKKRIKYIQGELKDLFDIKPEEISYYMEFVSSELENFGLTDDDKTKLRSAFEKYVEDASKIKISRAFRLDVLFTVNGNDKLEFEKEVYFAVINGDLMMLSHTPEEPEEDNEHFSYSNDINPKVIADEVEHTNMDIDFTDRGESDTSYAYMILEEHNWTQKDDSGNRLIFKPNEETGVATLEYVDASGNVINGYKGVCEYKGQFINIYEDYEEDEYKYIGEKKVITLFFCNNDKAIFAIDGKEVEFVSDNTDK